MQSSNPVFGNAPALRRTPTVGQLEEIYRAPRALTVDDVVVKTSVLLAVVVVGGIAAWTTDLGASLAGIAGLLGFGLALVNIFKRQVSPPLVLAYAACEGLFLGGISAVYDARYPGIVLNAAVGTAGVFGAVLLGYRSGRLRATPQFAKVVSGAFVGLFLLLVVNALASWVGGGDGLGLRSGGPLAVLFSLAFIAVGSMTFVLDFDRAEQMVSAGVPEQEAWRVAFGLVVGLVWLYLEVLRLLSYLQRR